MTADLHLHTHYSDGNWSPQQLVDAAIRLRFDCIAITDHDTVSAIDESQEHAAGRIRIIDGIEFNTVWINPDGQSQDVHILGYFINKTNRHLHQVIDEQQNARINYVLDTLERLGELGYDISFDDVKSAAGKGSLGRPHICAAMLKAGITNDVQRAYRMLMNRDSPCRIERNSVTPHDAIEAIRAAGGISSLAHPGKEPHIPVLVDKLIDYGLNAIEAYHRGHTHSMVKTYLRLAKNKGILVTGGSDCHGPFENYPASIGTVKVTPEVVRSLDAAHRKIH